MDRQEILQTIGGKINRLTPNDPYMSRTAPLTSKCWILYIYSTNIGTEYFKHALYSPFFSLQNAVCLIMLTCLVPVLFTFYIQDLLKVKKNNSGAKGFKEGGSLEDWKGEMSILVSGTVKQSVSLCSKYNWLKIIFSGNFCYL